MFSPLLPPPLYLRSPTSQLDDGVQNTGTRKFLMVLPVATFLLASHGTAWERQVREERGGEWEWRESTARAPRPVFFHTHTHLPPLPLLFTPSPSP